MFSAYLQSLYLCNKCYCIRNDTICRPGLSYNGSQHGSVTRFPYIRVLISVGGLRPV